MLQKMKKIGAFVWLPFCVWGGGAVRLNMPKSASGFN